MGGAGGLQIGENRASHQVQCSDQSESGLFCPILNYLGIPQPVLKNQPRCQWPHHKGAAWLPHSQASLEPRTSEFSTLRINYYAIRGGDIDGWGSGSNFSY